MPQYDNQVLAGVQSRIKARLDESLKQDSAYKAEQAKGLHDIIWSTNPAVTDEMRQRAHDDLQKLYPTQKDLLGRIRDVSSKVFGFLKAPPEVASRSKSESEQMLGKVTSATPVQPQQDIDPQIAETYSGLIPPPPTMQAAPTQTVVDPNVAATYTGMTPPPTADVGPTGMQPTPLPPPPTLAQNSGAAARAAFAQTKAEEIEKENRTAANTRETKRLEQKQQHENAMALAEQQQKMAQQYGEHWAASGRFLVNQLTGEKREMESEDEAKRTADVVNYRYYEAQELGAGRKPKSFEEWQKMLLEARAAISQPYYDITVNAGTPQQDIVKVPRSDMDLPRDEIARRASQGLYQSVPRTLYTASGMPSVGGASGVSTTAPPTIPADVQNKFSSWKQSIDEIEKDIIPGIEKQMAMYGPVFGKGAKFLADKLGGYGLTPDQEKIIVQMRETLMGRAFGEGGKQLTPTELGVFQGLLPTGEDTFSQAMVKARRAAAYLRERYAAQLWAMPDNQRRQMKDLPPAPSAQLDEAVATAILKMAGGNKDEARNIARSLGYEVK